MAVVRRPAREAAMAAVEARAVPTEVRPLRIGGPDFALKEGSTVTR